MANDRQSRLQVTTIPLGGSESGAIAIADVAFGALRMPASIDGTKYTVQTRFGLGETFVDFLDSAGDVVEVTHVDGGIIRLPDSIYASFQFRFVSDATETQTRQLWVLSKS